MAITMHVARLLDAIEDVPNFPFKSDVIAATKMLERSPLVSDEEAAVHLRKLIAGAREMPKFPFGADVEDAENALKRLGLDKEHVPASAWTGLRSCL